MTSVQQRVAVSSLARPAFANLFEAVQLGDFEKAISNAQKLLPRKQRSSSSLTNRDGSSSSMQSFLGLGSSAKEFVGPGQFPKSNSSASVFSALFEPLLRHLSPNVTAAETLFRILETTNLELMPSTLHILHRNYQIANPNQFVRRFRVTISSPARNPRLRPSQRDLVVMQLKESLRNGLTHTSGTLLRGIPGGVVASVLRDLRDHDVGIRSFLTAMAVSSFKPGDSICVATVDVLIHRFQSIEELFPAESAFLWNWIPSLLYSKTSIFSDQIALAFAELLKPPADGFELSVQKANVTAAIMSRLMTVNKRWKETDPYSRDTMRESLLKLFTIFHKNFGISAPNANHFAKSIASSYVLTKDLEGAHRLLDQMRIMGVQETVPVHFELLRLHLHLRDVGPAEEYLIRLSSAPFPSLRRFASTIRDLIDRNDLKAATIFADSMAKKLPRLLATEATIEESTLIETGKIASPEVISEISILCKNGYVLKLVSGWDGFLNSIDGANSSVHNEQQLVASVLSDLGDDIAALRTFFCCLNNIKVSGTSQALKSLSNSEKVMEIAALQPLIELEVFKPSQFLCELLDRNRPTVALQLVESFAEGNISVENDHPAIIDSIHTVLAAIRLKSSPEDDMQNDLSATCFKIVRCLKIQIPSSVKSHWVSHLHPDLDLSEANRLVYQMNGIGFSYGAGVFNVLMGIHYQKDDVEGVARIFSEIPRPTETSISLVLRSHLQHSDLKSFENVVEHITSIGFNRSSEINDLIEWAGRIRELDSTSISDPVELISSHCLQNSPPSVISSYWKDAERLGLYIIPDMTIDSVLAHLTDDIPAIRCFLQTLSLLGIQPSGEVVTLVPTIKRSFSKGKFSLNLASVLPDGVSDRCCYLTGSLFNHEFDSALHIANLLSKMDMKNVPKAELSSITKTLDASFVTFLSSAINRPKLRSQDHRKSVFRIYELLKSVFNIHSNSSYWTTCLAIHAKHSDSLGSRLTYEDMKSFGVDIQPSHFRQLLDCYTKCGDSDGVMSLFNEMINDKICPSLEFCRTLFRFHQVNCNVTAAHEVLNGLREINPSLAQTMMAISGVQQMNSTIWINGLVTLSQTGNYDEIVSEIQSQIAKNGEEISYLRSVSGLDFLFNQFDSNSFNAVSFILRALSSFDIVIPTKVVKTLLIRHQELLRPSILLPLLPQQSHHLWVWLQALLSHQAYDTSAHIMSVLENVVDKAPLESDSLSSGSTIRSYLSDVNLVRTLLQCLHNIGSLSSSEEILSISKVISRVYKLGWISFGIKPPPVNYWQRLISEKFMPSADIEGIETVMAQMRILSVTPDSRIWLCLLQSYTVKRDTANLLKSLNEMSQFGIQPDLPVCEKVLSYLWKSEEFESARQVVDSLHVDFRGTISKHSLTLSNLVEKILRKTEASEDYVRDVLTSDSDET